MSGKASFSEDLIGEFQEAFMLFDTKGDGMIPVSNVFPINEKGHKDIFTV